MSQNRTPDRNRTGGQKRRRPLTPEQKRLLLKRRKMKRLKKRLQIIIPIVIIVIAIVIIVVTLVSGKKSVQGTTSTMATEVVQDTSTYSQADENAEEVTGVSDSSEPGSEAVVQEYTEEPAVIESPVEAQPAAPAVQTVYTGNFVFDDAYVRAVQGETTGPDLVPDYSKVDPAKRGFWPATTEGAMPVLYKAENYTEKAICITIDDCYQADNLKKIVQCALDNNAKLTIFPIGSNIRKEKIGAQVKWAYEMGMEIENHTFNHVGLYHFEEGRMTDELWYQWQALNQLLGVNYQEHFFRPHGGDERNDQRDHAYIRQLGMNGIAMWSVDGSKSSIEKNMSALAPGQIYLFHTTNNDWNLLSQLIPYAASQGYRMITMNEMFGLPANEISDLSTVAAEKPKLEPFNIVPAQLKGGTYMRAVAVVQSRLIELGWLKPDNSSDPDSGSTGYYGKQTKMAVGYFQQKMGLDADGIAGPATQKVLFSSDAQRK